VQSTFFRIKDTTKSLEGNNFTIVDQGRAESRNKKENFTILTVCEIVTVIFFFITLVLCFKVRLLFG